MSIAWFVAKRYLRSPNRPAVLRLVTVFSVIGVAAGVCTLVIALAMNTGFRETLQEHLPSVCKENVGNSRCAERNARGLSNGTDEFRGAGPRHCDKGNRCKYGIEKR